MLETTRNLVDDSDASLAFDEVIASRLSTGGAQGRYGVEPGLTALGKCIDGGLPVGGVRRSGGRGERVPPDGRSRRALGTFNGNPATMAGGEATLELLGESAIPDVNGLGRGTRARIAEAATE